MKFVVRIILLGCLLFVMQPTALAQMLKINMDGKTVEKSVDMVLIGDAQWIQLRPVLETMGYKILFESTSKKIYGSKEGRKFIVQFDSRIASLNDQFYELADAPKVVNGVLMGSMRALSEITDAKINFDEQNKELKISTVNSKSSLQGWRALLNDFKDVRQRLDAGMNYLQYSSTYQDLYVKFNKTRQTNPSRFSEMDNLMDLHSDVKYLWGISVRGGVVLEIDRIRKQYKNKYPGITERAKSNRGTINPFMSLYVPQQVSDQLLVLSSLVLTYAPEYEKLVENQLSKAVE